MKEHRVIEKMIAALDTSLPMMKKADSFNPFFIEKTVDFFRMYADRTHHGKEENILFKKLSEKEMDPELSKIMEELIREHVFARQKVKELKERSAEPKALKDVIAAIETLISFYPPHIQKEDRRFFLPAMDYLTDAEKNRMLEDFREFDLKMIHEKYIQTIETLPSPCL